MTYDLPDKHHPPSCFQPHAHPSGAGLPHPPAPLQPPSSVLDNDLRMGWPGIDLASTAPVMDYASLSSSTTTTTTATTMDTASGGHPSTNPNPNAALNLSPPAVVDGRMRLSNSSTHSTAMAASSNSPPLDPSKPYHPEWGVMKEQDFHALTLKHQRDLENLYQAGTNIPDFYFWQANLGGYCMADMIENVVVSSEGVFTLVRRVVEGVPHPGRRKKKRSTN